MSKYVSLEHWPRVVMTYSGRPTNEEVAEFFAIMQICFQMCEQKEERFVWEFRFPQTDTPLAPMFSIRFIAWLVSNRSKLQKHLDYTDIILEKPEWRKWVGYILDNYTPVRPVHVKEM